MSNPTADLVAWLREKHTDSLADGFSSSFYGDAADEILRLRKLEDIVLENRFAAYDRTAALVYVRCHPRQEG